MCAPESLSCAALVLLLSLDTCSTLRNGGGVLQARGRLGGPCFRLCTSQVLETAQVAQRGAINTLTAAGATRLAWGGRQQLVPAPFPATCACMVATLLLCSTATAIFFRMHDEPSLTLNLLQRMREEFWETEPHYGGDRGECVSFEGLGTSSLCPLHMFQGEHRGWS